MVSVQQAARRDQADGLRKWFVASLPSLCTVLSAGSPERKSVLVQRLALNMAQRGRRVLVLDTRASVAGNDLTFSDVVGQSADGMLLANLNRFVSEGALAGASAGATEITHMALGDASEEARLSSALRELARGHCRLLVNAELGADGQLPLSVLAEGELVLHVDAQSSSLRDVRDAYEIMRSLKSLALPGTLSLLVTGASAARARQVQSNLFQAASRYLAMPVRTIVPSAVARHV